MAWRRYLCRHYSESCPAVSQEEPSFPLLPPLHLQQWRPSPIWSAERGEPVLDVTHAPHGTCGGFSYRFGRTGLPHCSILPFSTNEVLLKLQSRFKATTTKEAQTYSRAVLPAGSQRGTQKAPRWLLHHPGAYGSCTTVWHPILCSGYTE